MRYIAVLVLFSGVLFTGCVDNHIGARSPAPRVDLAGLENEAVKIAREGLSDQNPAIRGHAIEVVATSKRRELMPRVIQLLKDQDAAVRFSAAVAVGDMSYAAGEYALKPMLEDANPHARMAAAYALAKLGKTDYGARIRNMAMNKDQSVRANSVLLLGKLGNKKDLPLLYEVLRSPDSSAQARIQAVEAIAMLGDEEIYRSKLWPLLISKYADDRVMGIRGMGALGTTDSRNAIVTMLDDEVLEVRLCAAEQLGRMGDASGEDEVFNYLKQHPQGLQEGSTADIFATMAVGRIGTDRLRGHLARLIDSSSPIIRLTAAQSVLLLVEDD